MWKHDVSVCMYSSGSLLDLEVYSFESGHEHSAYANGRYLSVSTSKIPLAYEEVDCNLFPLCAHKLTKNHNFFAYYGWLKL
jgi:hypothetical protein